MENGPFEDVFLIEHRDILYAGKAVHKAISRVPITLFITKILGIPVNERDSYLIGVPRFESPNHRGAQSTNLPLQYIPWETSTKYQFLGSMLVPRRAVEKIQLVPESLQPISCLLHHLSSSCESSTSTVACDLVAKHFLLKTLDPKKREPPSKNQQRQIRIQSFDLFSFSRTWNTD